MSMDILVSYIEEMELTIINPYVINGKLLGFIIKNNCSISLHIFLTKDSKNQYHFGFRRLDKIWWDYKHHTMDDVIECVAHRCRNMQKL